MKVTINAFLQNGSKKSAKKSSSSTAPSNGVLRPSQRVSNLFQSFADTTVRPTLSEGTLSFDHHLRFIV